MSLNLNRVTLAGHLTRDPELRQVGADKAVASFALAINRRWKNQAGETAEETTFVDIEAWGRTGELIGQYLRKGSPAYLEGRLKLDTWEDKEGQKRNRMKVVADNVQFLANRTQEGEGEAPAGQPTAVPRRLAKAKAMAGVAAGEEAPF